MRWRVCPAPDHVDSWPLWIHILDFVQMLPNSFCHSFVLMLPSLYRITLKTVVPKPFFYH